MTKSVATRLNCTVSVPVKTNPQQALGFIALVEGDAQLFDILRFAEVVSVLADLVR